LGVLFLQGHWVNVLHRVLPYVKGRERAQALKEKPYGEAAWQQAAEL
jgi:hypothetical protein